MSASRPIRRPWGVHRAAIALLLTLLSATLAATEAPVAAGGAFSITRDVIAAGGGQSSARPFGLTAVHGEPTTGEQRGGPFSLRGGFLHVGEVANNTDILLMDGFEASDG